MKRGSGWAGVGAGQLQEPDLRGSLPEEGRVREEGSGLGFHFLGLGHPRDPGTWAL